MSRKLNEPVEMKFTVAESVKQGEYSNYVRIQHSMMDFRLDFAKIFHDEGEISVNARVFMSPIHAKMFMKALQENITTYEHLFGHINLPSDPGADPEIPSRERH